MPEEHQMNRRDFLKIAVPSTLSLITGCFTGKNIPLQPSQESGNSLEEARISGTQIMELQLGAVEEENFPSLTFVKEPMYGKAMTYAWEVAGREVACTQYIIGRDIKPYGGNVEHIIDISYQPPNDSEVGKNFLAHLHQQMKEEHDLGIVTLPIPIIYTDDLGESNVYRNYAAAYDNNGNWHQLGGTRNSDGSYVAELTTSPYTTRNQLAITYQNTGINSAQIPGSNSLSGLIKNEIGQQFLQTEIESFLVNHEYNLLLSHIDNIVGWISTRDATDFLPLPDDDLLDLILKQINISSNPESLIEILENLSFNESSKQKLCPNFNALGGIVSCKDYGNGFFCSGGVFVAHCLLAQSRQDRSIVTYELCFNKEEWENHWKNFPVTWTSLARRLEGHDHMNTSYDSLSEKIPFHKMTIMKSQFLASPLGYGPAVDVWANEDSKPCSYGDIIGKIFETQPHATVFVPDMGIAEMMILTDGDNARPIGHYSEQVNTPDKDLSLLWYNRDPHDPTIHAANRAIIPYVRATNNVS